MKYLAGEETTRERREHRRAHIVIDIKGSRQAVSPGTSEGTATYAYSRSARSRFSMLPKAGV